MKVSFITYGCTMNQGDTEILKGIVAKEHQICPEDSADVVVVNSCAVIGFTERKILKKIRELKAKGKKVVVAGCLSAYSPEKVKKAGADEILTPKEIHLINQKINGSSLKLEGVKIALPKLRHENSAIAIVAISEGCLGSCSYCATRIARGRLRSFPVDTVVEEVKKAISQGYREIQLTAQDTGVYGFDMGTNLAELLRKIASIPGEFRVRVGMMNPTYAIKILDDLIEAYSSDKIYKFLHLPVQSGSNAVLRHMNRGYTVEEFLEIVRSFRRAFPELTLSTDVIVGYPTETQEDFELTYRLIEELKPDILNITRFSPREGTPAARLRDIHEFIKKERSRRLTQLMKKIGYEKHRRYVGRKLRVLITKPGKNGTLLARTDNYKQVVLQSGKIGEFTEARIKDATSTYLIGEN